MHSRDVRALAFWANHSENYALKEKGGQSLTAAAAVTVLPLLSRKLETS
jgi:hypothetical protein